MTGSIKHRLGKLAAMRPSQRAVDAARRRMDSRWIVAYHKRRGGALVALLQDKKTGEPDKRRVERYLGTVAAADKDLENDSAQRWQLDCLILEREAGGRAEARKSHVWGRNEDQLIRHSDALAVVEQRKEYGRRITRGEVETLRNGLKGAPA